MKQSRAMSFLETALSTLIGLVVALATQIVVFPLFGFHPSIGDNLAITGIFTVVSIARQFVVRRLFEALHIRRPLSPFMQAAIAELFRQIEVEGYDAQHDDGHRASELASGSAAYLLDNGSFWPWQDGFNGLHPQRRKYVIGAAMALAAGEHFDRNRKRGPLVTVMPINKSRRQPEPNRASQ